MLEITKEDLELSRKRVDRYIQELDILKLGFERLKEKRYNAFCESENEIPGAMEIKEELTGEVTNLREHIILTNSDLQKSIEIYKKEKKGYNKIAEKIRYNRLTKLEATNNGNPYTDKELIQIFLDTDKLWSDFLNEEIDFFRRKYKRTYLAIEALVRVKQIYLETGEIREFYMKDFDNPTKTAEQFKRVLDKLIKDNKI